MQVRIDTENARAIGRIAKAYFKAHKRRKSSATITNELLRNFFDECSDIPITFRGKRTYKPHHD